MDQIDISVLGNEGKDASVHSCFPSSASIFFTERSKYFRFLHLLTIYPFIRHFDPRLSLSSADLGVESKPDPDAAASFCSGGAYGWNRECRVIEIACRASYGIELNEGCRGRGRQAGVAVDPIALRWKIKSRGRGDYLMGHDMEDIVAVLDGRPEVVGEIGRARITLRQHLLESFRELLESHRFREALSGPLAPDRASQSRVPTILSRIKQVTEL